VQRKKLFGMRRAHAGASVYANSGHRIVDGYRRMQPASDMLLGWSYGPKRHFFIRQLRDMKLSLMVETFGQAEMDIFARRCGKALALSHARSGNSSGTGPTPRSSSLNHGRG